jgi:CheY-like chemotaxis protein
MSELADPASKEILIVDDDESVLNLLEILVRHDGFRIDLARTGDEALEKLKRPHDAVILDLMLPGSTTGFEVLKRLPATRKPIPPVIVVTAFGSSSEVQAIKSNPLVVLFLDKPIKQKLLLDKLHEVLKTRAP